MNNDKPKRSEIRRNVTFGPTLLKNLDREAAKRHIPFSTMVRMVMAEWLAKLGAK